MTLTTDKTVGELAVGIPGATRAFEKLGIDYCCGGGQTLEQACRTAAVPFERVVESLESAELAASTVARDRNWQNEPLPALITHIQDSHHVYTRTEIARLGPLFDKVCAVHGKNHPELLELRTLFAALAGELNSHLMKEETILFPYVLRMLEAASLPAACFGSVRNPVAMMMHEHDDAGNALRAIRLLSHGYTAPADACISFRTLYQALADFEADLHQHIHLENNVLFPQAVELERSH